jgi:hypothetical protein
MKMKDVVGWSSKKDFGCRKEVLIGYSQRGKVEEEKPHQKSECTGKKMD